jgi:hypothetical protein
MTIKVSTGLRNAMLASSSVKGSLDNGFVKIYAGTVPATADAALGSATLLCTVSVGGSGTGLTFASSAASGIITKATAETWSGTNVATGTATFYRHVASTDTGVLSTTEARIQGNIATAGSDMNLTSTSLVNGAVQVLDYYSVALPTL